jgi:hypothetical protein
MAETLMIQPFIIYVSAQKWLSMIYYKLDIFWLEPVVISAGNGAALAGQSLLTGAELKS